jgi:hypothetical protein
VDDMPPTNNIHTGFAGEKSGFLGEAPFTPLPPLIQRVFSRLLYAQLCAEHEDQL